MTETHPQTLAPFVSWLEPERADAAEADMPLPRWFPTLFGLLDRLDSGAVEVRLPDGRLFTARGAAPGPTGRIDVHNPEIFPAMVRHGDLAFPEGYMDGWWSTPDLQTLLDVLVQNNDAVCYSFPGSGLVRAFERLRHALRANTRRGARRNIARHYDLGNDFYRLWLDETMTYSSALFRTGGETLAEGQRNKYAAICDLAGIREGDHVLEIGCGWGGFAEFATAERGARVTALTLSREQRDFTQRHLFEAGLADRAEILLLDYRDVQGTYDAIVSIEMLEAVGEAYWPRYFATLRDRLKPGATAAVQTITIPDRTFPAYRRGTDFIRKHIFPGGMLPPPGAIHREAAAAGLKITEEYDFADSYSATLRLWRRAFHARRREITDLGFDDCFLRMWDFYLASCAATFHAGTTGVSHLALRRAS
jgi:cyclopropane-fatty-acyl-phospholipid synthase